MTLKQLTYFLKIAETGNLTKAAAELNMSQPPLSYQLKLLEDELGVSLFIREPHSMKITDEGILLRSRATQILSLVDRTVNELAVFNENQKFMVNIGTVTSSGHNFLPKIIKSFKKEHPLSTFNIYDGSSMYLQELLHNAIIDIAILREPFPVDQFESLRLNSANLNPEYDNDYFVAVGKEKFLSPCTENDNCIDLKDVLNMPLVVHRKFEKILEHQARQIDMRVNNLICKNDSVPSSIEWTLSGACIAIMPFTSSLLIGSNKLIVRKIINPSFFSNMYIVWRKDAEFSMHTRAFLEKCIEYLN